MKKNLLFLLFALVFTGNPALGMKRKRQDGDDPNPTKRRKIGQESDFQDRDNSILRKRKRDEVIYDFDDDKVLPEAKKQKKVAPKEIATYDDLNQANPIIATVPNTVFANVILPYHTFQELRQLMLVSKTAKKTVEFFLANILRINPQNMHDLLVKVFYQKIAEEMHICMIIKRGAVETWEKSMSTVTRIRNSTHQSNRPLIIDFEDDREDNISVYKVTFLFNGIPNLKELYINLSLKKNSHPKFGLIGQRIRQALGIEELLLNGNNPVHRRFFAVLEDIRKLAESGRLHTCQSPYAQAKLNVTQEEPEEEVQIDDESDDEQENATDNNPYTRGSYQANQISEFLPKDEDHSAELNDILNK